MIENIALAILGFLMIAGGCMAAFVRHVLYSIIGLGVALLGVAGFFLYLGSPFVAAMQILIYVGGIAVAMVFAMMLSVAMSKRVDLDPRKVALSMVAGVLFFIPMAYMISRTRFEADAPDPNADWSAAHIGRHFLEEYNLVFEGLSLVLLLAIIGAVLVAKREGKVQ